MEPHACACGCGTVIESTATYVKGHHWRVLRAAAGVPDMKTCERCGREYARTELAARQSNKHWMRRRYCSSACQEAALSDYAKSLAGENHPGWKGAAAKPNSGRDRARKLYAAAPCEVCGATPADRHHVDGDTTNNAPENIRFLCRTHHIRAEDRMAYRRLTDDERAARVDRKRAQARKRARRYRERKRAT